MQARGSPIVCMLVVALMLVAGVAHDQMSGSNGVTMGTSVALTEANVGGGEPINAIDNVALLNNESSHFTSLSRALANYRNKNNPVAMNLTEESNARANDHASMIASYRLMVVARDRFAINFYAMALA